MNSNRIMGGVRDISGKLQDAAGGSTGNMARQARGNVNQTARLAQHAYGQAVDEVRGFTSNQPATALFTAAALGVAVGFLLGRR
jgi:uncharacterized protein YjbJ (UPF0337 family)